MICTRANSVSDLGSSDFRGRSRNSLQEYSVLFGGSQSAMNEFRERHEQIPRAPNFHSFVRFGRSRNFVKMEKFGLPGPKSAEQAEFSFRSRTQIPRAIKFSLVCGAVIRIMQIH